ncbi:MAG: sigma-70 family RNA polymerase sigma factor [Myxococcales bacterium]|nr:sigma-70 family RNA polymerase sigma factor [Myxococcales bacterium]MCB9717041.1 sigma-70 family RNA polymerase sigma factor [Myxococcales bacterium]
MPTELELLDAWRAGDRDAGSALLERQFDGLFRFFRSKVAPESVGELVQQTMMKCVEHRDDFRGDAQFSTYVLAIARRVLIASYRARDRDARVLDPLQVSVADLDPSPSRIMVEAEQHRLLLRALRSIPLDHQILLELYYWERLTGPALAAALEIPEGTVRTRLRRARQLLEEAMRAVASSASLAQATLDDLDRWVESLRDVVGRGP